MNGKPWFQIGIILGVLALMAKAALAEEIPAGTTYRDLGGGHYTIGAGWRSPSTGSEEDPFSGTLFEPAEATARGIYQVNEGLLRGTNLVPTWEEIKKEGALKKTFYF